MVAKKGGKGARKEDDAEKKPLGAIEGKVISGPKIKKLMASKRRAAQDTSQINGDVGQEIKNARKDENLHTGAFGWTCRLDKLEPEALRNWLDHFFFYLDISGLQARAEAVQVLPLDEEEDEDSEETDNVHRLPNAAE